MKTMSGISLYGSSNLIFNLRSRPLKNPPYVARFEFVGVSIQIRAKLSPFNCDLVRKHTVAHHVARRHSSHPLRVTSCPLSRGAFEGCRGRIVPDWRDCKGISSNTLTEKKI